MNHQNPKKKSEMAKVKSEVTWGPLRLKAGPPPRLQGQKLSNQ